MYYENIQSSTLSAFSKFYNYFYLQSNTSSNFIYDFLNSDVILTDNYKIKIPDSDNKIFFDFSPFDTMLASEFSLSKDWLLPEEDEAWKDL